MSAQFDQCLANAVAGKEISRDDAARLKSEFDRLRDARANSSTTRADAEAKAALAELLKAENDHARRKAKLAIRSIREIDAHLQNFRYAGEADLARAALSKLENFGEADAGTGFSSVEGRGKAIIGMAHGRMESLLHHFRRGAFGGDKTRWNAAQLDNVVREAFGQDTGDVAAKAFARTWADTAEWLRQRFNAAGGAIGKLEGWGLPQHHDARALRRAGRQVWKDTIRPKLDLEKMRHPLNDAPVTERELDSVLDGIYTSIITDGWIDRQPSRQRFGAGALANQRAEHRFLIFKSPEEWMDYQRSFGNGDAFATMMGHISIMAKDIAAMEVLGPNPSGTIEWLKQAVMREGQMKAAGQPAKFRGKADRAVDRARRYERRIDEVWGSIRSELSTPVNGRWANGFAAARSVIVSGVLGQAAISAMSDISFAAAARRFAGLPAETAVLPDLIKSFGATSRREAVESGLVLDAAQHAFGQQARYVGTLQGPEWANYLADRVLTYSGLSPWTQAAKHAFGMAFQLEAGKRASLTFNELPEAFQRTFGRYGISPREWDMIRKVPLHRKGEAAMLRPNEVAERIDPKLAERYLEMILQETEFAVPSNSHRSRTALLSDQQPGTLWGEALRSFAMFKSFGAVVLLTHGGRVHQMLSRQETRMAGAAYAGSVLFSATLLGGLSMQMKHIAGGRDPAAMDDPAFWGAALLQGGGLGIFGDYMFGDLNRFGGGFGTTLAGPLIQKGNDFWNLTAGNVVQLASDEKTHFGRELVRFSKGLVPGGTIWYLKLAYERVVLDQLQYLVDPEAAAAFKRQQQNWKRNTGQEFFWKPGQVLPDGMPQLNRN